MAVHGVSVERAIAELGRVDSVIDARSPAEFAEDHLPGAVNWPVLDDEQRRVVGTLYAQASPFDARKLGAVLVARNVADAIERNAIDRPRHWRVLVYCWRGGQRSGALAHVLGQIGFDVLLVEGGYRAFRRAVLAALQELPRRFDYRVICGTTGSGKSRLLHALEAAGAQVLDLEALAGHRGSVLGLVPGQPQPGQKRFETLLWDTLRRFDAARPVFVESESRQVGKLRVPEALVERMRGSPCLRLELPLPARVALLLEDYDFFVRDAEVFCGRLDALRAVRGNEIVEHWQADARAGRWPEVVRALLEQHYDPMYLRSMTANFAAFSTAPRLDPPDGSAQSLSGVAAALLARGGA